MYDINGYIPEEILCIFVAQHVKDMPMHSNEWYLRINLLSVLKGLYDCTKTLSQL